MSPVNPFHSMIYTTDSLHPEASAPPASYFHSENDEPLPPYETVTAGINENHSGYGGVSSSSSAYDLESKRERSETTTSSRSRQLSTIPTQGQPFSRSRCSSAATNVTNRSNHQMTTTDSLLSSSTRLYPSLSLTPELSPIIAFVKEEWEPALDITQRKPGPLSALVNRARSGSVEKSWRRGRIEVKDGLVLCSESKQSGSGTIWGGMDFEVGFSSKAQRLPFSGSDKRRRKLTESSQ